MQNEKDLYLAEVEKTRPQRMKWFNEARFGMFVHWGLYAQIGRNEWVMNIECIPKEEYETLAETWKPKPRPMRSLRGTSSECCTRPHRTRGTCF